MTHDIEFDVNGMPFESPPPAAPEKPEAKPGAEGAPVAVETADDLGLQEAGEAAFGPPRSMHEYRMEGFGDGDPQDVLIEQAIRQTLYAEKVPTFAGNVFYETMVRLTRDGEPDDAALDRMESSSMSELEREHGAAGAQKIIADAQAVTRRLCERNPGFAELLERTGAGNDRHLIETLARVHRAQSKGRTK